MMEGPTILVVDDDSDIRRIVATLLGSFGYRTMTASNGLKGLSIVDRSKIDGIILDLEMPVMNGLTMLRRLRDKHQDVPILIMSARTYRDVLLPLADEKAIDYITKPFDMEDFKSRCQHLFRDEKTPHF